MPLFGVPPVPLARAGRAGDSKRKVRPPNFTHHTKSQLLVFRRSRPCGRDGPDTQKGKCGPQLYSPHQKLTFGVPPVRPARAGRAGH